MQRTIYVSTSCKKKPFDLQEVLSNYHAANLRHVELGSSHHYNEHNLNTIESYRNHMNFLVHNYFPPHKEGFALNLSSLDKDIWDKSVNHAKTAIDLCSRIGSPIYSIHAGMLRNPQKIEFFEGFSFDSSTQQFDYDQAFAQLVRACSELNEYAYQRGVKFAIENSGGHPSKYGNLMITTINECKQLIQAVLHDNFGILLDIGHLNVTHHVYGQNTLEAFIRTFRNYIFQVHIHSNDGSNDQHLLPKQEQISILKQLPEHTYFVLESMNLSIEQITATVGWLNNQLGE